MGPDGLLRGRAAEGRDLRRRARPPRCASPSPACRSRRCSGVGAKTYETYKTKYGKEPTSYALYAAEGTRVIIDAHQARRRRRSRRPRTRPRSARPLRKAIASTKNFEGINGKWSFDENGDVDYDTMSGFKAVKADGPIGCKFQFESILE